MYNDTIKAENKIISSEDLTQIFQLMNETLKKYKKISEQEEIQNRRLEYNYQKYTFKDEGSKISVTVDFTDNTNISFDNFENFMGIFYSRISEIKTIDLYFYLKYDVIMPEPYRRNDYCSQDIHMYIKETKLEIETRLKSDDHKLDDVYNLIKEKVINAPEKYDDVIKNNGKITSTVILGAGLIPGMILAALLLFIPNVGNIIMNGYVLYPIAAIIIAYIVGGIIAPTKLDRYYNPIMPEKIHTGYDSDNRRIYKDDLNTFVGTSEILIGNKVNNLDNRRIIRQEYEKAKSLVKKELIVLLLVTVAVIVAGIVL